MSNYKEKIFSRYVKNDEDKRYEASRSNSLEFHYTKMHLKEFITKETRILEIGCATGYYGFYYANKCKSYLGVDIYPPHIELFNQKIKEKNLKNVACQVGDATDLADTKSDSFDVVLCLGPMYHLPKDERDLVFSECHRVCKSGGVVAFAYINKIGLYCGACVYDDWKNVYPNAKTTEFVFEKGTDNERPDLFHFTTPEELEQTARKFGFEKIKNLGVNFMITMKIVNEMDDERFELMRPLYDKMCEHESCTGMSDHALLICRRG